MTKPVIVQSDFQENENEGNKGDKIEPRLPDDDGGDGDDMDIDIDLEKKPIYRPPTLDECRRAFVFDRIAPTEYMTVELCEQATQWLKSGELPKKPKSHLKTVKPE